MHQLSCFVGHTVVEKIQWEPENCRIGRRH